MFAHVRTTLDGGTRTCAEVAARPARSTCSVSIWIGSVPTASTAAWTTSSGAPASSSAPSSMSPLAPARHWNQATVTAVPIAADGAMPAGPRAPRRRPAPNPLSMLLTTTPGAQEFSIASRAASPPYDVP